MDGLTIIQQIRTMHPVTSLPIIALTAFAMPQDRETCLNAGANEYIAKPVKLKELHITMQHLLATLIPSI